MKRIFLGLALLAWLAGCSPKKDLTPEERQAYEASLSAWHTRRLETVKAPDGWLNLVGLYWLEPGPNTFGSNEKNNIVFPKGKIAEHAGYFIVQDNQVILRVNTNVPISVHGKPIATEQVVFHPDSSAIIVESGSLRWNIIRRDTKLAVRLRDLDSEATKSFAGVERYPVDPAFRVAATSKKRIRRAPSTSPTSWGKPPHNLLPERWCLSYSGKSTGWMFWRETKRSSLSSSQTSPAAMKPMAVGALCM